MYAQSPEKKRLAGRGLWVWKICAEVWKAWGRGGAAFWLLSGKQLAERGLWVWKLCGSVEAGGGGGARVLVV